MQLPQSSWLQRHYRSRDSRGDWEIPRVDDCESASAARSWCDLLLGQVIGVGTVPAQFSIWAWSVGVGFVGGCPFEDIWIYGGDRVENGRIHAKVFGEDVRWSMGDPVVDVECGAGGVEVACKKS